MEIEGAVILTYIIHFNVSWRVFKYFKGGLFLYEVFNGYILALILILLEQGIWI